MPSWGPRRKSSSHAFGRWLLLTNTGISAACFGFGDVTSQLIEAHPLAVERSARVAGSGAVLGVSMHFWYKFLDVHLPGTGLALIRKKILMDMCCYGPFFCAAFVVMMGLAVGDSKERLWSDLKQIWPRLYALDWCVYPPAQFINFRFVPPQFRVLYLCGVAYVVDTAVCWIYHRRKTSADDHN